LDQPSTHEGNIDHDDTVTESLPCPLQLNMSHKQLREWPQGEVQPEVLGKSVPVLRPPDLVMPAQSVVAYYLDQPSDHEGNTDHDDTVTESLPCPLQLNMSHKQLRDWPQGEVQPEVLGKSVPVLRPPDLVMSAQIPLSSTPPLSGAKAQIVWLTE
jgi:hypothetical protein